MSMKTAVTAPINWKMMITSTRFDSAIVFLSASSLTPFATVLYERYHNEEDTSAG